MMVTSLQEKVLSFIQQLHTSESERKRLRDNMDNMNQNINQLTQYQEACADLERELYGLRKQVSCRAIDSTIRTKRVLPIYPLNLMFFYNLQCCVLEQNCSPVSYYASSFRRQYVL